jgi:hypothetical protein
LRRDTKKEWIDSLLHEEIQKKEWINSNPDKKIITTHTSG